MEYSLDLGVPSEKQKLFLTDTHRYVAFGGARGGGKSHAVRLKAVILALKYPGIIQTIVRKSYPELYNNHIMQFKTLLRVGQSNSIARYNDSRKEITFFNGSKIFFKFCSSDSDLDKFQGLQTHILYIDEAGLITQEQIGKMNACVRSADDYPKRTYYTLNPGGVSHGYFRRLFVDRKFVSEENPEDYSFIQSLVTDNPALDQEYIKTLENLPPKIRDAWLYGRWDVFEGAFFESFRESPDLQKCNEMGISEEEAMREGIYTHVIKPFDVSRLDSSWKFIRSYDWGFGKPFSMGYWVYKDDVLYRILEVYGSNGTPNEGRKWTNKEQFDYFQKFEHEHPWLKGRKIEGVADPSIWDGSHDTYGISCAEEGEKHGIYFQKGNNERVAGWMQVQERLRFDEHGKALIYFFDNCKDSIRTIPMMMYDKNKVEDLDSSLEDHACDEIRYCAMQHIVAPRTIKNEDIPMCDPLNQYRKSEKTAYIKYL